MKALTSALRLSIFIVSLFLINFYGNSLFAQTPTINFGYPINNMTNVSLEPTFAIRTNYPIDVSSCNQNFPESGWITDTSDTNYDKSVSSIIDSSLITTILPPTVWLMEKWVHDSIPDSLWSKYVYPAKVVLLNDSTMSITDFILHPGTSYVAIVKGVRVIASADTHPDTMSVSESSITFSTIPPLPRLIRNSVESGKSRIRCNDTVWAEFNLPMSTTSTSLGNLLEVVKIVGDTSLDSNTFEYLTQPVTTFTYSLSTDGKRIFGVPTTTLSTTDRYFLNINLGYLTGESYDTRKVPFEVASSVYVYIQAMKSDTSVIIPFQSRENSFSVNFGDTLDYIAPDTCGYFTFIGWNAPDFPSIDTSTNPHLVFPVGSCTSANPEMAITAEYQLLPGRILTVNDTTGGTTTVVNHYGDSLGTGGVFFIPENEPIKLVATSDSGNIFTEWVSNDTLVKR
jgi:hypothetical protein